MDPNLWKLVRNHKEHIIAVLKNEERDLLVDARSLFENIAPIAYNLFHAFIERNLKPQARVGRSQKYWADLIAAEFATTFHPYAKPT